VNGITIGNMQRPRFRYARPGGRFALALSICAFPLFGQPSITEFAGLTAGSAPAAITLGPDGACWFIEQQGQRIGRITPSGQISEYAVPHASAGLNGIATGPDGALWFTEGGVDRIGRITTAGVVTGEFALAVGSVPFGIVDGPYGALWFTEQGTGRIGRITPAGAITEYPLPWKNSQLFEITLGFGGSLWFADGSGNIGEISPAGAFARYPIPTASGLPRGITPGPDYAMWFTESASGKIGRITVGGNGTVSTIPPPGVITEYNLPNAAAGPQGIAFGPDGALWFTEMAGNRLGRITLAGAIAEYDLPSPAALPYGIAVGPDGALWFAESAGQIGRAALPDTPPSITEFPTPPVLSNPVSITTGPDGALWFTGTTSGLMARVSTSGTVTVAYQRNTNFSPWGIALGSDGKLWYTGLFQSAVGNIDTAGNRTEYRVPIQLPYYITAGPDGALWFTDGSGDRIGRITTAGAVTLFPVANAFGIRGITVGPDGALWFAIITAQGGSIGRMTTAGAVTEYPIPTPGSNPLGITPGPDGALWFTESQSLKIGRISLDGAITEFTVSTRTNDELGPITAGPDGALWFTEGAGLIGRVTTGGSITEYPAPAALLDITSGPDGALWFTVDTGERIGRLAPTPVGPPTTTRFLATNPPGLTVTVDGIPYATPQSFTWPVGSQHTIGAAAPASAPGVRYSFTGWSDGQPQVHTVTTGPGPAVFVANFAVQYQLYTVALPSTYGSIVATPASSDGYYDAGATVQLTAIANTGYQFAGWDTASGPRANNPLVIVMDHQRNANGLFNPGSCVVALSASPASIGVGGGSGTFAVTAQSGCYWLATTDAPWVTTVSEGIGSATYSYTVAPSPGGAPRTAVLTVAGQSFTITQGLSAVGVTPAAGSGLSQVFTLQFSDPAGYQNIGVVNLLIAGSLDARHACYLAYSQPLNLLYLVNDAGNALLPAIPLNGSGAITNSQCLVNGSGWSAGGSGSTLTLTLNLTFNPGFSGDKALFLAVGDQAGNNSGWQPLGTWNVPGAAPSGPAVGGVSPARSNATSQTFTFTFTDTNGVQDLGVVNILINNFLTGFHACYLAYSRLLNVLYLVDDSDLSLTGLALNGSGAVSNSQCTVYGVGSAAVLTGNTLTLTLNLAFLPGFLSSNEVIYMAARNGNDSQNSGWQAAGTVTVPY